MKVGTRSKKQLLDTLCLPGGSTVHDGGSVPPIASV